jgi:hypothetical protein
VRKGKGKGVRKNKGNGKGVSKGRKGNGREGPR